MATFTPQAAACASVAALALATGIPRAIRLTTLASTPRGLRIWGFLQSDWTLDRLRILSGWVAPCHEISDIF
ncbi:hypothetical protein GCM10012289_02920 [Nonomuraea cavernae]|uniref:Uncharacterized protein n=1 Tax=Nonomuraea cavernae TaxID=2045107 RepID=A0A917YNC6_9ACTN|nr:hypothetical protein GCM10012289_02920 [Nonomuraea cavernae]